MKHLNSACLFIGVCTLLGQNVSAATYPPGFTEKQVATGLISPSGMDFAPDGRLFIGQQKGQIRVVKNDTLLSAPLINFQSKVDYNTERGLMGLAVDPDFVTNHYLYVFYTAKAPTSHNRISRFTVIGDVADTTETILFEMPTLPVRDDGNFTGINVTGTTNLAVWHMGGGFVFGNDGKLYVAVGEHEVTKTSAAQNLRLLWGKVLRLNSDGTIPTDNPFYDRDTVTGQSKAIWALGFRNPYTMAVQKSTGRLFIGNVGDATWEDVDTVSRGKNYGWPVCEGSHVRGSTTNVCSSANNFTLPLLTYRHGTTTLTGNCAIAGGFTYNFRAQDTGRYFFGDFTNGTAAQSWIRSINPVTGGDTTTFATGFTDITGIKFSPSGNLYVLTRGYNTGTIDTVGTASKTSRAYKVSYDLATGVQAPAFKAVGPALSGFVMNLGAASLRVPEGITGVQLFDLSGKTIWEAHSLNAGQFLSLPSALPYGALRYRWIGAGR